MVTKAYGTLRLCNDFWKLDTLSQVDSYLMTQVDELTECLDKARSIPTLDLTKGCHPQHKKQPSANQMDCGSSDFSLLACKGDPPTYKRIKNVWLCLRNNTVCSCLPRWWLWERGRAFTANERGYQKISSGLDLLSNHEAKKWKCMQHGNYLFLRKEARSIMCLTSDALIFD